MVYTHVKPMIYDIVIILIHRQMQNSIQDKSNVIFKNKLLKLKNIEIIWNKFFAPSQK